MTGFLIGCGLAWVCGFASCAALLTLACRALVRRVVCG
jgi:hypothetical protein